ncbi:MAG: hypothetical protein ACKOC6_06750 [bacterium]
MTSSPTVSNKPNKPSGADFVSLYEFMPYGAPELMEVARNYMFRATVTGI